MEKKKNKSNPCLEMDVGEKMKKKIYIQLENPWKYTSGGIGKSLIKNPPKNVKYIFKNTKKIITDVKKIYKINFLKRALSFLSNFFPIVKFRKVKVLNNNIRIIHCEHFLAKNKDLPWIVDIEGLWQLFIGKKTLIKKEKIKEILSRKNCKKIIFWTKHPKKDAEKTFPSLKKKMVTIYPAVPTQSFRRKKKDNLTLLFVGRYFYGKGGFHTLKIMDILTKKFKNVNAIYVGEITKFEKETYSKNPKIEILGMIPHKRVIQEIYPQGDILIYPGYSDSFGFAYLEAMSFGIPIVTAKRYNTKEIIDEGKTGFLVNYNPNKIKINRLEKNENKLIDDFCEKASLLIENKKLREEMSKNCIRVIKDGKFSIKEKNKKLKKIYEEALK